MKATDSNGHVLYLEFANKKAAQNFIDFNENFKYCKPTNARLGDPHEMAVSFVENIKNSICNSSYWNIFVGYKTFIFSFSDTFYNIDIINFFIETGANQAAGFVDCEVE